MEKSVDLIVFGATGFTGKYTVRQLARLTKEKYLDITWGIAGRSKEKLQHLATEISNAGLCIVNMPIIECDVEDEGSLKNMLRMTRVVINCTATDVTLSPKIVEVCIESGTHYVDVSAEILHILTLYQKYHKTAENAHVLITPACGYSSIPAEVAMIYLERVFKGTLQSVECYVENIGLPGITETLDGAVVHTGTWKSFIHILVTFKEYLTLKAKLLPQPIESEIEKVKRPFFFTKHGQLWFPYGGPENDVVEISQKYLYEKCAKKPVNFSAYTTCEKWYQFVTIPLCFLCYYLCYFKFFAKLMFNYPRLFTFGYISEKEPTYEIAQKMQFTFLLNGEGWDKNDLNCNPRKLTKRMSVKVTRRNPYDATAIACIMSAVTILKESSNVPRGVIMPGAALYKTKIVDRLIDGGYEFDVLDNE